MLWFKRFSVFGVVCMLAAGAVHAQDLAITGKDFESGAADAKLAEIARQAAASGKTVIVTTPPYWQSKVAGKMRSAAPGVQVKTTDAFFENVLVRIVDAHEPAKSEAAKPEAAVAARVVEKPVEPAKTATRVEPHVALPPPAESVPKNELAPAPKVVPAQVAVATPASPPAASAPGAPHAAEPATHPPAVPEAVASIAPLPSASAVHPAPAADNAAIKRAFENQFNLGRPAVGAISAVQLQKGDEIFVRGPVRAAVRRERSRVQLFWVEGDLQLDRAELTKSGTDHYLVSEPMRNTANPSLRAMHSEPKMFTASLPQAKIRADMERHFNDAKAIAESVHAEDLRYGDLFYIYRSHAVVFRRTDQGFDRYWLEGPIDLNQAGLVKDGDAYRIVSEKL